MFHYHRGLIVVDRACLKEYFHAPIDALNFLEAVLVNSDFSQIFHGNKLERYHVGVVRNQLTQNISVLAVPIADELNATLVDELDPLLKDGNYPGFKSHSRLDIYHRI